MLDPIRYLFNSFFSEWVPVTHTYIHLSQNILCPKELPQLFRLNIWKESQLYTKDKLKFQQKDILKSYII